MPDVLCNFTLPMFITMFSVMKTVHSSCDKVMLLRVAGCTTGAHLDKFGSYCLHLENMASGLSQ